MRALVLKILRRAPLALLLGSLPLFGACTAAMQSLHDVTHMGDLAMQGHFDPHDRYMRVTVDGRPIPMVLGFIDGPASAPTDVWYTGMHEVLRLRDGMITGTAGMPVNWVDVHYSAWPTWSQTPQTITRTRDLQPGYRFGLHDTLRIAPIPTPSSSRLIGIAPESLRWFSVTDLTHHRQMLYAVRGTTHPHVVYGEQCLDAKLCLTWQDWRPPQIHPAVH